MPRRPGQEVLVRAKPRRRVAEEPGLLGAAVRTKPVAGYLVLTLPRQDGCPGVKVLWRGLRTLHAMVLGYRAARGKSLTVQSSD